MSGSTFAAAHATTPDFAVQLRERELWFEVTEADRPGRKRNLEYAPSTLREAVRTLRDDEWIDQNIYAEEIDRLCRQKSSKEYDRCDGLIINSNAFGIIDDHLMTDEWWSDAARSARDKFSEVWRHHRSQFERIY